MSQDIRLLRPEEIEVRVGYINAYKCSLLLYIDARCAMKILDETYGALNWQRHFRDINGKMCCTLKIYNDSLGCWIEKEDVGTESYAEKEKGEVSDAFKRACVCVGIGRELYTAPNINVDLNPNESYKKGDKINLSNDVKFKVSSINYNEHREITELIIKDQNNKIRYMLQSNTYGNIETEPVTKRIKDIMHVAQAVGHDENKVNHLIEKKFHKSNLENLNDDGLSTVFNGYLS